MDLDFSPEQQMLRDMVRGVCASSASQVRALEDDPVGYDDGFWKQLAELDLLGLTIAEEHGGSGMSLLDAVVVYEELGRSLVPSPHFVSSVLAASALRRGGSDEQRAMWLPRIAAGDAVLSIAWLEPDGSYRPAGVQLGAASDGDGFVLHGVKRHVPFASAADRLLVLARTAPEAAAGRATAREPDGDGVRGRSPRSITAPADIDLFLVDPNAPGVTLTQQHTIASDTQYRVDLDGVHVAASDRLGELGTGWATWDATMHDGAILAAALATGGARHALDITVQYAKDRKQFDKPLGAFQALAHDMADAKTNVDGATLLVHEAAWAASAGRDVRTLAPMAKLFACRTFRDVTAMAQQIFGGVGFTTDYDIQLYFRRAKALQLSWWDDRELEERIAAGVLD